MKNKKIVYANIEAERVRKRLTQTELSAALGVSSRTYYNWQQGENEIPASKLLNMANLFNCSIDYLLQTD